MGEKSLSERYEDLKDMRRRVHVVDDLDELLSVVQQYKAALPLAMQRELRDQALDLRSKAATLVRQIEIFTLAFRVFGDPKKAEVWLSRPNKSLGGQVPAELLKDELGTAVVRETLEQIDHGIFA
jgi:putative toxin-antitoxin system antitoxin component (TIGR02293 family)